MGRGRRADDCDARATATASVAERRAQASPTSHSSCPLMFCFPAGTTLAPLPATRRGYGIVLNCSPKDQKIIYTNGRLVIIRSLEVYTQHEEETHTRREQGREEWQDLSDTDSFFGVSAASSLSTDCCLHACSLPRFCLLCVCAICSRIPLKP